jgi:hypothetical protein
MKPAFISLDSCDCFFVVLFHITTPDDDDHDTHLNIRAVTYIARQGFLLVLEAFRRTYLFGCIQIESVLFTYLSGVNVIPCPHLECSNLRLRKCSPLEMSH